jgi:hypothetical protein
LKLLISGTSSWSIWKFRKDLINYLENKDLEIFYYLKDELFLKKISKKKYKYSKSNFLIDFISLWKVISNNKIKVVLEYDLRNLIKHKILRLIYKRYNIIIIWAGLGNRYNLKGYFNNFEKLILKSLLKECSKVILINKFDFNTAKKYHLHNNISYINTEGFNYSKSLKYNFKNRKKYKFVSAFRPIKSKGIYEIIKTAIQFPEHNFYFYTVKNNKIIKYNSKNINLNKIQIYKNIFIKDIVNDFEKELPKYDCLISASYGEGFGMTIAEAVNNYIPVISTNVSGPKSVFKSNSMIFIKAKNDQSLIQGINIFLRKSSKEKIIMVKNAKNDLKKIDNKQIFKKVEKFINEIS